MQRHATCLVLLSAVLCAAGGSESAPRATQTAELAEAAEPTFSALSAVGFNAAPTRLNVTSVSRAIAVRVEPVVMNASSYRVIVANRSMRSLIAIQYEAFRGSSRATKGRRHAERNEPIAAAGREYTFEIRAGTPIDRVAITALLWDDGTIEGDGALAADERTFDIGKSVQLRRVLKLLHGFGSGQDEDAVRAFREQVAALPLTADVPVLDSAVTGMQQVKDALLNDLDQFEHAPPGRPRVSFATWIADTTTAYEDWLARIAAR